MENSTPWAKKKKTFDAIMEASIITCNCFNRAESVLAIVIHFKQGKLAPERAAELLSAEVHAVRTEWNKGWTALWKIAEWLIRSRISLRRGNEPVILETNHRYAPNWHAARMLDVYDFVHDLIDCVSNDPERHNVDGAPLPPEQIQLKLGDIFKILPDWSPADILAMTATAQVEACRAIAIWEKSIRTDADEESSGARAAPLPPVERRESDSEFSPYKPPKYWAKVFDCNSKTIVKRFKEQKIKNRRLSDRRYSVALDEMPKTATNGNKRN
jgi:hypothetical protein